METSGVISSLAGIAELAKEGIASQQAAQAAKAAARPVAPAVPR